MEKNFYVFLFAKIYQRYKAYLGCFTCYQNYGRFFGSRLLPVQATSCDKLSKLGDENRS